MTRQFLWAGLGALPVLFLLGLLLWPEALWWALDVRGLTVRPALPAGAVRAPAE